MTRGSTVCKMPLLYRLVGAHRVAQPQEYSTLLISRTLLLLEGWVIDNMPSVVRVKRDSSCVIINTYAQVQLLTAAKLKNTITLSYQAN